MSARRRTAMLRRLEDGALVGLVAALLVLAIAPILLRNTLGISPLWVEPVARHLVMWTGFLGALVVTRENRHIRIDLVLRFLPERPRQWVRVAADAASAALCRVLARVAIDFVADERRFGAPGPADVPAWVLQLVFPLCFAAMAWRYGARCQRHLASRKRAAR